MYKSHDYEDELRRELHDVKEKNAPAGQTTEFNVAEG